MVSPFLRKRGADSANGSNKEGKTICEGFIIHVKPELSSGNRGHEGFLIYCNGFAEKVVTDPLFTRNVPKNKAFLEAIEPIRFCFALSKNGKHVLSYNNRPQKVLAWDIDTENAPKATQENLAEFYNTVFLPAVQALGIMHDGQGPYLSTENPYTVVSTWSEVLQIEDMDKMVKFSMDKTAYKTVAEWMQSKDNLYSLFPVGGVPKQVINSYGLLKRNLHEDDAATLDNLFAKKPAASKKNNDDDIEDTEEEDDDTELPTDETPMKPVAKKISKHVVTPSTNKEKSNTKKTPTVRGSKKHTSPV